MKNLDENESINLKVVRPIPHQRWTEKQFKIN